MVAGRDKERFTRSWIEQRSDKAISEVHVAIGIDQIAKMKHKVASGIVKGGLRKSSEIGRDRVDMRIGTDIDLVIGRRDDDLGNTDAIVIGHRLRKAGIDNRAGAVEHTTHIVIRIASS